MSRWGSLYQAGGVARLRAGDDRLGILRDPLVGACGALLELPLVAEQVLEEVVAPLRGRGGPGDLEARGDDVVPLAGAEVLLPAKALLLDRRALGLGADVAVVVRVRRAVG